MKIWERVLGFFEVGENFICHIIRRFTFKQVNSKETVIETLVYLLRLAVRLRVEDVARALREANEQTQTRCIILKRLALEDHIRVAFDLSARAGEAFQLAVDISIGPQPRHDRPVPIR